MLSNIPNQFRQKIKAKEQLMGLWLNTPNPSIAEMDGMIGYDRLVLDGEHSAVDVPMQLHQLQALNGSSSAPVGRPPANDPTIIKQYLDIGFYNLLIPFIESKEEAERAVASTRYAPAGIRGVAGMVRACDYGATPEFYKHVNDNITLLLQIESRKGVEAVDEIAAVEGVDGIFIGPADLSAALGYIGQPNHPEVEKTIQYIHERTTAAGKATGILTVQPESAKRYLEMGFHFVAVGLDISLLKQSMIALRQQFR